MTDLLLRLQAALVERYAIERELGQGGMALVFLARDLKHRRAVAIKVLRPELAIAVGAERFLGEIETVAALAHPHILPLYDSGEAAGFLYYVMPYVEGESLRERLTREKQLPLEDALRIAGEVATALSYAHSRGVVHRDIKPENILLEAGEGVVGDFGIARAITAAGGERLTQTGVTVGTPGYMSPEQAAGERELDGRSDVYSLACVLYEMLAGNPPFLGASARAILARQSLDPVPRLRTVRETVPEEFERAVVKALAKAPADRFANHGGPQLERPRGPSRRREPGPSHGCQAGGLGNGDRGRCGLRPRHGQVAGCRHGQGAWRSDRNQRHDFPDGPVNRFGHGPSAARAEPHASDRGVPARQSGRKVPACPEYVLARRAVLSSRRLGFGNDALQACRGPG